MTSKKGMASRRKPAVLAGLIALGLVVGASAVIAAPGKKGHTHATFAAGKPGDPKKPFRVVEVRMGEGDGRMFYLPNRIDVQRGEQIKFVLLNDGELDHEFMLDTVTANAKHAIAMQKNPEMEHDDPNGKQVKPKKTGEILWHFTKAGTFEFACLHPGHYDGGMKGVVVVGAKKPKSVTTK